MEEEESDNDDEEVRKLQICAINSSDVLLLGSASSSITHSRHPSSHYNTIPSSHSHHRHHRKTIDRTGGLKLSQIRVQDLLHKYLDKKLELSFSEFVEADGEEPTRAKEEISSIRLFKGAPSGISLSPKVEAVTRKITGRSCNDNDSSEDDSCESFDRLQAVAVDGVIVLAEAARAAARALATSQKESIATAQAARKEEERVASLKRQRGEEWLPSFAKEMTSLKNKSHEGKPTVVSKKRKASGHTWGVVVEANVLAVKHGV